MSKEKINVSDLAKNAKYPNIDNLHPNDWDTCEFISDIEKNFDAEKGFIYHEVVIQRLTDGKFFKFTYTQFRHNGNNIQEQIATEVEEKTKIIKYYE